MFNFDTNKNIEVYTILTSAHEINEVILKDIGYTYILLIKQISAMYRTNVYVNVSWAGVSIS